MGRALYVAPSIKERVRQEHIVKKLIIKKLSTNSPPKTVLQKQSSKNLTSSLKSGRLIGRQAEVLYSHNHGGRLSK